MVKFKSFLKKLLIIICCIAILATCFNISIKLYRKVKMDQLIEIVTDETVEPSSEVLKEIETYIKNTEEIKTYEEFFLSAYLEENRGNTDKAKEIYLKAIEQTDDDKQIALAYRRIGMIDCDNGNYSEANKYLLKSLEYDPDNSNGLLYLAESYLQLNDYANALINVNKYAQNNDLTFDQYKAILTMFISIKEYKGAIKAAEKAIEKYPDKESELLIYRLQANLLNNNYDAALSDAKKYIKLTGTEINEEILVASYYYALGMYQNALDMYLNHIDNEEYNLLEQAIECAYQIDDYETMYELANIALEHFEGDEQINYFKWKAIATMQLGNYYEALSLFTKYLEVNPEHHEVIYLRAMCYFALGQYENAIDDFTLSMKESTLEEDSIYNRALCYVQINDLENAMKDLETVVKKNSGSDSYKSAVELLKLFEEENKE